MRKDFKEKQAKKKWYGQLASPSKMSFNECPFEYYSTIDDPNKPQKYPNVDPESLVYKAYNGHAKHAEFQEALKNLDVPHLRLFPAPKLENIHPKIKEKMEKHGKEYQGCIEFPLYFEDYNILSYIDAIVERCKNGVGDGKPIPGDFKIKHYLPKIFKDLVEKNELVDDSNFTQVCVYMWGLNKSNLFDKKIEEGWLWYYNSPEVGNLDAEREYKITFSPELEELTKYLLDTHKEAALKCYNTDFKHNSEECAYRFCQEKLNIKKWYK